MCHHYEEEREPLREAAVIEETDVEETKDEEPEREVPTPPADD